MKNGLIALSVLVLVFLGGWVYFRYFFDLLGPCSEDVVLAVKAPSLPQVDPYIVQKKLVNCGATSDFATDFSIKNLKTGFEETVLSLKGNLVNDCEIDWSKLSLLKIDCKQESALVYHQQTNFEGINVLYLRNGSLSASKEVYFNPAYGFSFEYPSDWIVRENDMRTINKDLIFSVRFSDPVREKDQAISDCLDDGKLDWAHSPTDDCKKILEGVDPKRSVDFMQPRNIFIRVSKTDRSLQDWLISTYKGSQGSELERYKIGEKIKLSGRDGYYSSIGCCGGIDISYVVKRGDYIYEFGTNSDAIDLKLLQLNFKFELTAKDINAKVEAIDSSTELKVFKLYNDQLLDILGGPAYDNGRELTGYFKNNSIQKILDEIGLSFGLRSFTYYFDNNELIYVHETEEDYSRNQDGSIDFEKPLIKAFDASYLFSNGKLIDQITKGKHMFNDNIDPKDIQKHAKEDLDLLTKQYQAK